MFDTQDSPFIYPKIAVKRTCWLPSLLAIIALSALTLGPAAGAGIDDLRTYTRAFSTDEVMNLEEIIFTNSFEPKQPEPKFVFATSGIYDGDLKTAGAGATGLEGADNLCNQHAQNAGLPGTYTAWLSTDGVNARERISQGNGPYNLPIGGNVAEQVADDLDDLLTCEDNPDWPPGFPQICLDNGFVRDETGDVQNAGSVWTNTRENGNLWGPGTQNGCENWTNSTGSGEFCNGTQTGCGRIGALGDNSSWWTNKSINNCDIQRHLYCFQD